MFFAMTRPIRFDDLDALFTGFGSAPIRDAEATGQRIDEEVKLQIFY